VHFADQPAVGIGAQLAYHHVGDGFEFSGGQSIGQQQVDGAGEAIDAQGTARLANRDAALLAGGTEPLHAAAPGRIVENEIPVGILRQAVRIAFDTEDGFDARVVRSEVGEADGPVLAEAIVRLGLELVIAETEGLPRPEEGAAAEEAHAHPIIGLAGGVGVGDFLFVDPGVGVESVRLEDVRQPPGLFESAPWQGVCRADFGVFVNVGDGAGIEDEAGDAFLSENFRRHAAGMSGADDQHIHGFASYHVEAFRAD
jgi:hypothetical protein